MRLRGGLYLEPVLNGRRLADVMNEGREVGEDLLELGELGVPLSKLGSGLGGLIPLKVLLDDLLLLGGVVNALEGGLEGLALLRTEEQSGSGSLVLGARGLEELDDGSSLPRPRVLDAELGIVLVLEEGLDALELGGGSLAHYKNAQTNFGSKFRYRGQGGGTFIKGQVEQNVRLDPPEGTSE